MFVEPVPEVARVVFIGTPHRGSYVAGRGSIARLVRWLFRPPTGLRLEAARNVGAMVNPIVPSAVDNMSPRNPFIRGIRDIPVSASVKVNSIIAVQGDGPIEQGDDGVVKYSSAHIEPVESELVVRSGHSAQDNPQTIEEVRRILRRHVGLE
jgi:hypothetical protein